MTDQNDPVALARRFIDLWQDQLGAVSRDTELNAAMQRWLWYWMNADVAAKSTVAQPPGPVTRPDDPGPGGGVGPDGEQSEPPGTQAVGVASGDRDADLDELARRVRELEEQLASLERGATAGGEPATDRPGGLSGRPKGGRPANRRE